MSAFVAPMNFELSPIGEHILPLDLQPGALVTFSSARYDSERPARYDNTFIELADERGDIVLHIAVRRRDRLIAFNDKVNGRYGQEEIIPLANMLSLENVTIEVMVQKTQFVINVNDVTVKLFHRRTEGAPHAFTYNVTNNLPAFVGSLQVTVLPNFRQSFIQAPEAELASIGTTETLPAIVQLSQFEASAIAFSERTIDAVEQQSMDEWGVTNIHTQALGDTHSALKVLIEAAVKATATKPHYFWSGRVNLGAGHFISVMNQAALIAASNGGTTLEMTIRHVPMPNWNPKDPDIKALWEWTSAEYAKLAAKDVYFIKGDMELREGNVWENIELPALKKSPSVEAIYETVVHKDFVEPPHQIYPKIKTG